MVNMVPALLFSALVLPGSGHFYVKQKWIGFAYLLIVFAALFFLFQPLLVIVNEVSDMIMAGEISADVGELREIVNEKLQAHYGSWPPALLVLIGSWIGGLITTAIGVWYAARHGADPASNPDSNPAAE